MQTDDVVDTSSTTLQDVYKDLVDRPSVFIDWVGPQRIEKGGLKDYKCATALHKYEVEAESIYGSWGNRSCLSITKLLNSK